MSDTTPRFNLGSFSIAGSPSFAGMVVEDKVIAIQAFNDHAAELGGKITGAGSMLSIVEDWDRNLPLLNAAAKAYSAGPLSAQLQATAVPVSAVHVHAPIEQPRQIFMARANYRTHVVDLMLAHDKGDGASYDERKASIERMVDNIANNGEPFAFIKIASAVTGPYDTITVPENTKELDWELELAVIIGRAARHVSAKDAMSYVAGYCNANDMSARDILFRNDLGPGHDWTAAKCAPGYMPMGPYFVPAEFVSDPHDLKLQLKLNGKMMQDERTNDMIHNIPRLIEAFSHQVQLWPGDIIATGSPNGNGKQIGVFVQPGDVIEAQVGDLGMLRNTFAAPH